MQDTASRAIAIVGVGAVLPDAPNAGTFWTNIKSGRYSISEVTPDRWDPAFYYDADRAAPDKSYSKIGGWVRESPWDPLKWHMAIPPRVAEAMDGAQRWGIACTREALADYGYPGRPLETERTAVILGNAMAGEMHYLTALRAFFPEYAHELEETTTFAALPPDLRRNITMEWRNRLGRLLPPITEDSMPGELSNCLAGRIANLYNFRGPNFVCDAACASAMAAIRGAMEGLIGHDFDAVITGGIDRNMGAPTFVKFCKIGALSASGSRPYAEGADGFVMGEGAAIFLMKRLADAERDGDRVYAVLRGIGGSSDGKGKGITAPNPVGQRICIERAWENAGISPATASLIEGHGTSTSVGDVVEFESLAAVLQEHGANGHPIALGSVKSNIGHLKGASGAAGILKTVFALHDKMLPPSVGCDRPNPNIDFAHSPLYVNTELRPWIETPDGVRRAGVSAFGFGGTNFHAVLEEYIPHRLTGNGNHSMAVGEIPGPTNEASVRAGSNPAKAPLRGALVAGAASADELAGRLRSIQKAAEAGRTPAGPQAPDQADLRAPERIAIDYGNAAELADRCGKALAALASNQPSVWKALRAQGIFRGHGPAPKVAFLYTGQGSQYVNMLRGLRAAEPIVARTFDEADRIMAPLLGKVLSDYVFVNPADAAAVQAAEEGLRQTAITQPAVLAIDQAITLLLAAYGILPDMTMGHSLGEYGALVASGALPFDDALEAVSARGREMTRVSMADNGRMAAVFAPLSEIDRILRFIDGYVVIANINSDKQAVIGGASAAVERAVAAFQQAEYNAVPLPVSHAFHTSIVGPASGPLRSMLERLRLQRPRLPIVANVTGEFYPEGPEVRSAMLDILARQIASPVQFVKGLRTLYGAGARVFIEVGPKKALHGFVEDVLGSDNEVLALFTNHPKFDDLAAFNQALCGLYASGLGAGRGAAREQPEIGGAQPVRNCRPVVISGASLGLPGTEHVFDDANMARILNGEQFIDVIPTRYRKAMLDKHITRLVKSDNGDPRFEEIREPADVIKLAARGGAFDLAGEFGVAAERVAAFDRSTQLAIAAGFDALRDAGIPLVRYYKSTSKGTRLPDRWGLASELRDDTGVIFASAFPGCDAFAGEMERYYIDRSRREQLGMLEDLRGRFAALDGQPLGPEIERRIGELKRKLTKEPYSFDRRFLLRTLPMGHSQFAELIGARGPNTQINSACASTATAVVLAEDWIRAGRCRRVIVISADDVVSDHLLEWFGAGFLASGAAATDEEVENAAIPFDRRRHGMIVGMGAAAMVVESAEAAAERGLSPICEVLGAVTANSAYHATRLDIEHIRRVMEDVVRQAETRTGIRRREFAQSMVFLSHETYTPARGGSASAEIHALRGVFGEQADRIVIANTKGLTGHAMAAGIEDVVAVKALETGCVPAVANFKEVDPELGPLNLSRGGAYPVEYALRLGAGFGSQISMTVLHRIPSAGPRPSPDALGYEYRVQDRAAWHTWLNRIAGHTADLEIAHRILRVRDSGGVNVPEQPERVVSALTEKEPPAPAPEPVGAAGTHAPPPDDTPREPAGDPVRNRVLALVVEKTGYPKEMLDLDLDLEADLGIDTVKQAELFAAVREIYQIPRDPNLKLRDFATLARVIGFVHERRQDLPAIPQVAEKPSAPPPADVKPSPAPPPAAPSPSSGSDEIRERVLEIVAEKTGYPKEMLDPDLDLEADLGIDTVKQAEMFASVRAAFDIPRDQTLKLRDFPTLGHVIRFAAERRAAPSAASAPQPAEPLRARELPGFEAADRIPRRVPVPVLRPPLDLCKPTGVALEAGSRILIMPDRGGVAAELAKRLLKSGMVVATITDDSLPHGPFAGVYWLPALDDEGDLEGMTAGVWHEAVNIRVKSFHSVMRSLYGDIALPGTFLISATRLGGRHGYEDAGAHAPLGGAVTGFTKAYKRERPEVLVKAVDFEAQRDPGEIAGLLVAETLRDPGAIEIGYAAGERWTIGLEERPFADERGGLTLDNRTVFVVTGAAGSIVSAITADLAAASGGTFYLLDVVPAPDPASPDLKRFAADKEGLKRDLFARMQARGERATPALVEKELAALERAQAAAAAMDAVRAAGGAAFYHSVDLGDGDAVARVIADVRQRSGRIDVLLHAAGIDRSHALPDKDAREFSLVFDVKSDGCFHLLRAIGDMPLRAMVAFSSIAGRFGNSGQTDYSSANDLLCKIASSFRRTRPATRALAIDWTAWGGIGMAARGSIPKIMAAAGIDTLPPEAGVPWIRRELTAGGPSGEIVVAGALGALHGDWDVTGGLDAGRLSKGPMIRSAKIDLDGRLTVETLLDPADQPFLRDHVIDGTPVLPGVMGIEAFAEAALSITPGRHVAAVEDVELLAPFKFYRNESRAVTVETEFRPAGDELVARCRLIGKRTLALEAAPQTTIHFTGIVRLSRMPAAAPAQSLPISFNGSVIEAAEIYRIYFHGPAYRVLNRAWWNPGGAIGQMATGLPGDHQPADWPLAFEPRLIELCFQTAGIWEMAVQRRLSLPRHVGRLSLCRIPEPKAGPLYAVVRPNTESDGFDAEVVDEKGTRYLYVSGYRTIPLREDIGARLFATENVMA